jgi:peptidoglycan/xylan/chitin deacetylase (PgdA/CDA1 family)
MYNSNIYNGSSLPQKTLCLTFDDGPGKTDNDGPGPHTLELAGYLNSQGIAATFFVVGKYAAQYPDILENLLALGHLIGNHTFDHPNLQDYINGGGDAEEQILRTDAVIKHWVDGPTIYFRPPYGTWPDGLSATLNNSLLASMNHVGPIIWDIDGGDWASWQNGTSVDDTVNNYLNAIEQIDHGIILNHDCTADMDVVKENNMTFELMQKLIPKLKDLGYKFVRLDQIENIAIASFIATSFALQASNGKFISPQDGGGGEIIINGPAIGEWEQITVVDLGFGKVALQAPNGLFFSPQQGGGGEVLANGPGVGAWEPLDLIQLKNGKVAFRTITGHFLTRETFDGGRLMANVRWMRDWEIFNYNLL